MTDQRTTTTENATTKIAAISDIVAGVALGLFIGALVGLSLTSGVTSTVVTTLVAVLAIFFGLADTAGTTKITPASGRIAGFCFAALLATTVGIYARTHNLLSPPGGYISDLFVELKSLGYTEPEVREMIKAKYFSSQAGAIPERRFQGQTGTETHAPPNPAKQ